MAERIAFLDFSKTPKDFRQIALEPGYPLLDRQNANGRIASKWLGRFLAEPERRGDGVSWFVRSEQGERLAGIPICPLNPQDLKGSLKKELVELKNRLEAVQPRTRAEQVVHRTMKENLDQLLAQPARVDVPSYFFKYQNEQGKWRLLWLWGYERTEPTSDPCAICIKPTCRLLFVNNAIAKGQCPHCQTALPIPPNPWVRVAIVVAIFLMLSGAGFYGWWIMQPRATLKGVVIWAGNNQPVPNAEIRIPSLDLSTTTDEGGQFLLDRLPEGEAEIEILAEGFSNQTQTESLVVGEETFLKIPLTGNATLTGKVVNSQSKTPLEDVEISIVGTKPKIATHSDRNGVFLLNNLPGNGEHEFQVLATGFPEKKLMAELKPKNTKNVNVLLVGEGIVSGFVRQANNQAISGAKVELIGSGQWAESKANGAFVINKAPIGNAELKISALGFGSHRMELTVKEKEETRQITLLGAGILKGKILAKSDGRPIEGVRILIKDTQLSTTTNSKGEYSLVSIPAGTVTVVVDASKLGYQTVSQVLVVDSKPPTPFDASLVGGAALAGVVMDGTTDRPLENAEIQVSIRAGVFTSDPAGKFQIDGLKAGSAKITVSASGFKTETITKTLAPDSGTNPLIIKLKGDAKLRGTVTDSLTGKPIPQAMVKIVDSTLSGSTNTQGIVEVDGAKSGLTKIEVSATGYPSQSFTEQIKSGIVTPGKWELTGDKVLTGTVKDPAKNVPVSDAQIVIAGTNVKVISDAKGQFQLEKLPAKTVALNVAASGYTSQTVEYDIPPNKPANVEIELGGDAILIGDVYDALTSKKLADVKISLVGYSTAERTQADGTFRLANAFPGKQQVTISAAGYPETTQTVQLESKIPFKISIGLTGDSTAKGKILSPEGNPIAGAIVQYPDSKLEAETDAKGAFELKQLPGGKISLTVSAKHYQTVKLTGMLKQGESTNLPSATMKSGIDITGKTLNALTAKGLKGVSIKIDGSEVATQSGPDGEFVLKSVPVRPFTLHVECDGFYSESLKVNPIQSREIQTVLAPLLGPGETRIVLLWGDQVKDVDLHLFGPLQNGTRMHIWAKNPKSPTANLDVDNRNGYGPETITLKNPLPGKYEIIVHGYKDLKAEGTIKIRDSKAEVRIYQAGKKTGQTVSVSDSKEAEVPVWLVGEINVPQSGPLELDLYNRLNYRASMPSP